MKAGKPWY